MEDECDEKHTFNRSGDSIPGSALCMICFKPMCDVRCKGQCMRVFHSSCIKEKGGNPKHWKCCLCSSKEIERFSKMVKYAKHECSERYEFPGSGFSQVVLLDSVIPHKKRDNFAFKAIKCSECDKKNRSQLIRCITCGSMYHRGCLPINSIGISPRFIICPSHFQSLYYYIHRIIDNSSDYLLKSLQEQFDKLKGITVTPGRGAHFSRGRGRGRGRGCGNTRGGRNGKRLSHIIASDPTLSNTRGELIECHRCGKMRRYPSYIDRQQLPEVWFCEYNTWDKRMFSCDVENDSDERPPARGQSAALAGSATEMENDNITGEGTSRNDSTNIRVRISPPAIWGGESMKTNNKFDPSRLNSVALINYIYFSKIAQRAVHRTNYLGFVSASFSFNHNIDSPSDVAMSLTENTPVGRMAVDLYNYFHKETTCSIRSIMQTEGFFKAVFNNQRSVLVQCVRLMIEKNVIVLVDDHHLADDSLFVFNDKPEEKNISVKELRLRRLFHCK